VHHTPALDLLSKLPANSVGGVVSDPPFFIGIKRDEGGAGFDPWVGKSVSTIDEMINWYSPVAMHTRRVLRPGGACVIMGGSQSIAAWEVAASRAGLVWMADLTVLWNTGKPRARNFGSLATTIRWHAKPGYRHSFNSGAKRAIYSNVLVCDKVPLKDRLHAAQKPVELTNFLVSLLTNEGDTVVDPFCGSGSTLVSAAMCGRNFIGCDLDAHNVGIATSRTRRIDLEEADLRPIYLWVNGQLTPIEGD
jgi:site-specific DNA-methyltransferase (adenine-specific)